MNKILFENKDKSPVQGHVTDNMQRSVQGHGTATEQAPVGDDRASIHNPILEGVIWKQLLIFFFPILFGTMFQQLYNTVDAFIVGRFLGKEALSAVSGSSGMLVMLIVGFFVGLSSGAAVLVSQYYGAGDGEKVSKSVHTVLIFSVLCGAAITLIGIIFAEPMLLWLKTPEDTMELSILYLQVYCAGMIGNLLFNTGSAVLRAAGDSKTPTYALILCCMLNIVLDVVLVLPLHMGVFGAALATILAQLVSGIWVLYVLYRAKDCYRLDFKKLHMDMKLLGKMLRIGLPAGLIAVMYNLSNLIIQIGINDLGTDTVAAWAAYYKIDGLFWMTINAFGIAICTFVGQNFGAGKISRIYASIISCSKMTIGFAIGMSAVVYFTCPWLLDIFITDAGVHAIGVAMMKWLTPFYVLYVSTEIISGALRGVGDTLIPMILSAIGVCLLRSLWVIILLPKYHNIYTLMWSYPISWIITSAALIIYMLVFSKLKIVNKS